jgi:hypothetical protein
MGRKVPFRCSIRLHRRLLRPFSDSFYTSFSEIASSWKWSGGGIGHPCQRTQNDGGSGEVLHPLSVWNKQE